jgi:uncharacterized protein YdaU (DUF1376 family)
MTHIIEFPLHIGDFLSGTLHMDTLEKGAYIMLIVAHMQAGEQGLPNDDKMLARIAGVTPKVWSRIKPILAEKFTINENFWEQKKCIEVLRNISQKSSNARAKALKRHNTGDATAKPQQSCSSANHKPITNIKNNIKKNEVLQVDKSPPDKDENYGDYDFNDFWDVYPRKIGKGAARAAWLNQISFHGAAPETMFNAARNYRQQELDTEERYIKTPAKFLSEQRYLDESLNVEPPKPLDLKQYPEWQWPIIKKLGEQQAKTWFENSRLEGKTLMVPDKVKKNWIQERYVSGGKFNGIFNQVEVMA